MLFVLSQCLEIKSTLDKKLKLVLTPWPFRITFNDQPNTELL